MIRMSGNKDRERFCRRVSALAAWPVWASSTSLSCGQAVWSAPCSAHLDFKYASVWVWGWGGGGASDNQISRGRVNRMLSNRSPSPHQAEELPVRITPSAATPQPRVINGRITSSKLQGVHPEELGSRTLDSRTQRFQFALCGVWKSFVRSARSTNHQLRRFWRVPSRYLPSMIRVSTMAAASKLQVRKGAIVPPWPPQEGAIQPCAINGAQGIQKLALTPVPRTD